MEQTKRNERLRAAYSVAGYSQSAFARLCDVSQPAMSDFASYRTTPSVVTLLRMLAALEIDDNKPELIGYLIVDGRALALPHARRVARRLLEVVA